MKNLYVGNLPHSTTEPQLRTLFEAHGKVERINIVLDKETGRSKGFAFVEMSQADAEEAINRFNGTDLSGRALTVNEAKPMVKRDFGGGGRNGGGGGRNRY